MHLSSHDCDLLSAGVVPAAEAAPLRAHAAECAACAALLRDAEATRAAFLISHPPVARARALQEELGAARPARRRWLWALSGASAFAALLLAVFVQTSGPPVTRLKGGQPSCQLLRAGQVLAVLAVGSRGQPAVAGDSLRCTAIPAADGFHHLEIWGADAQSAHRLFGAEVDAPTELPAAFAISGSGEQRLFFVWSKIALPAETVAASLAPLPDAPVIAGARVEWLSLMMMIH